MIHTTSILATFSMAYILGSIPFGLIFTRLAKLGDIRKIGSGNIGATNVMRTGHKGIALLVLLCDGLKGYAAVEIARMLYTGELAQVAGLFAVLGHVFPVWLRFKGGKGVATTIGVFFALNWVLGASVCALWLLAFALMRISSVAAMLSISYSAIAAYLITTDATALLCLALAMVVIFTHRHNILRLLEGTELNFSIKRA
jgi:glycerol-3-phosphate acyltransferase PlsY